MDAEGETKAKILGFHLDRGIYTSWRFIGSTGPDTLTFGSQGIIISSIDLAACRIRTPSSCDAQSSAISAAVGAAAGWIGGLLVPTKP
jgi:hypothetical protein